MLNKLSGKNVTLQQDAFNLEKVSESMKMFVEKISSHEGAEFPKWASELLCRIVIMVVVKKSFMFCCVYQSQLLFESWIGYKYIAESVV